MDSSKLALALLRVVAGLLLLEHGLIKLVGFPDPAGKKAFDAVLNWSMPDAQLWIGAVIETVTGALVAVGLFTRAAAFIACGLTAVAFWQFHFMGSGGIIYPAINKGEAAALFCFIFFYIFVAGHGALSLDGLLRGKK
jgi:putative oxidoreductase